MLKTKTKTVFNGMAIDFAWAGSPSSLAYKEIRHLFFDEVNKYLEIDEERGHPWISNCSRCAEEKKILKKRRAKN